MAVLAGLGFSSCSESLLEIPQKGVTSIDSFYQTDEDALSALASVYHGFATNLATVKNANPMIYTPYMFAFNLPGDDLYAACKEYGNNDFQAEMNEFRYDDANSIISALYKNLYLAVYYCNLMTDYFQYGTSDTKDLCISEARVIRAWIYLTLALGFNDPPLVDTVLEGDAKPANYEGGHEGLLRWVAKECEESVPYLQERADVNDKNGAVHATKGLAWTIQGKALMFAGDYAAAMIPLRKVIDSKKYALVPGERFHDLFHVEGDGCEEKIFESNVVFNPNVSAFTQMQNYSTWQQMQMWTWRTDRFAGVPSECGPGKNGWGGLGVQADFAKEFVENDGDSPRRKATIISYDELLYDLNYLNDSECPTKEDKAKDPKRGISDIRGLYGNCEYLQYKRIAHPSDLGLTADGKLLHSSWSEANYTLFRYAEVLLMYAECCAQTGKDVALGLAALNEVQQRSGSGKISGALTLDAVKKEKKFEMWTEGCRFVDCVRWGDLDGMMKAGNDIPTLKDHFFDTDPATKTATHQAYVTFHNFNDDPQYGNGKTHGFVKGKHEFFPFPVLETSINPNIRQNPGW